MRKKVLFVFFYPMVAMYFSCEETKRFPAFKEELNTYYSSFGQELEVYSDSLSTDVVDSVNYTITFNRAKMANITALSNDTSWSRAKLNIPAVAENSRKIIRDARISSISSFTRTKYISFSVSKIASGDFDYSIRIIKGGIINDSSFLKDYQMLNDSNYLDKSQKKLYYKRSERFYFLLKRWP